MTPFSHLSRQQIQSDQQELVPEKKSKQKGHHGMEPAGRTISYCIIRIESKFLLGLDQLLFFQGIMEARFKINQSPKPIPNNVFQFVLKTRK